MSYEVCPSRIFTQVALRGYDTLAQVPSTRLTLMADLEKYLFSKDHEWVTFDGGTARIGITDFAQDALGDVVFVELPALGSVVTSGETVSEVESTKSVSDIYSPLDGTVIAVNTDLEGDPSLVISDPFGRGWIYGLDVPADVDTSHLFDEAAYRRFVEE